MPAERARDVRTEHRRVPQRADRHAACAARRPCAIASTCEQRTAVRRRRRGHGVLVGDRHPRGRRPVDLEPAAQHDVLELARCARPRRASRCVHELGALTRRRGRHPRRGLVHAEVRDDLWARTPRRTPRAVRGRAGRCGGTAARRRRRRGGTKSTPTTSVAQSRCLDQLRDARAELAAHPGDETRVVTTVSASGRRCGNRITSRIDVTPASNMTSRSTPRPMPPVGGRPYSSART